LSIFIPLNKPSLKPDVTVAEAIEKIDIGGPTLLRASAKNFAHVTVLSNPKYYEDLLTRIASIIMGEVSLSFRQKMAGETFALTNAYDGAITDYFASLSTDNEEQLYPPVIPSQEQPFKPSAMEKTPIKVPPGINGEQGPQDGQQPRNCKEKSLVTII
jgi:AICAR transformylase/IMP cyclohydrolase PurH